MFVVTTYSDKEDGQLVIIDKNTKEEVLRHITENWNCRIIEYDDKMLLIPNDSNLDDQSCRESAEEGVIRWFYVMGIQKVEFDKNLYDAVLW